MPHYKCYDGEYVSFCFFAINAFYLTSMAILYWYTRKTNKNQRYRAPEHHSNVYVLATPPRNEDYFIRIN